MDCSLDYGSRIHSHTTTAKLIPNTVTHDASCGVILNAKECAELTSTEGAEIMQTGKTQGLKTMKKFCFRDLEGSKKTIMNETLQLSKCRLNTNVISGTRLMTLDEDGDADTVDCERTIIVNQALKLYVDPTYYSMTSKPRGHALVIVNGRFGPGDIFPSADKSFQNLLELFSDLGYYVHASKDQTCEEMKKRIERFSQLEDHDKMDSCIVAISSHGGVDFSGNCWQKYGEYLCGTDKKVLYRNELLSHFIKEKCSALYRKPKLFFLDGCRGVKEDYVDSEEGPYRDMCVFSSSQPDYQSYDRRDVGSMFIKTVTDVFAKHAWNTPFAKLREKVKNKLEATHLKVIPPGGQLRKARQIPDWDDFLEKTLYFNPRRCMRRCTDEPGLRCNKCY